MREYRDDRPADSSPRDPWGTTNDATPSRVDQDALPSERVVLPARLDSDVARRVAIASNRDGIAIADLLGRAAAAYDWDVEDDMTPSPEIA